MRASEPPKDTLLRAAALADLPGCRHGFAVGRDSAGVERTFAPRTGLEPAVLEASWRGLGEALAIPPDQLVLMSQVHGATVLEAASPTGPRGTLGEADGMWTDRPGLCLAVRTADCVPVLLAAPGGVAVAHAGWRGTAAGVVPATVRALCEGVGVQPGQVVAAIGPCISGAAYEVGEEVVQGLRQAGLREEDFLHPSSGPRPHVDLGRAVQAQLLQAGVSRIERLDLCTRDTPWLHSHRRDASESGRLVGVIALEGP